MSDLKLKVCVVTVTYGDRWQFLEQVINRVLSFENVCHLIIADNNSSYSIAERVSKNVTVLSNSENLGSAGGYKQAIQCAYQNIECDLVWLLDDDNLPEQLSLDVLLEQWKAIDAPENKKAVFCLRKDRVQHWRIARGENPYRYYLVRNNFLGFHFLRIFNNQLHKLKDRFDNNRPFKQRVVMPYVPYGGLLMHKLMIEEIGFPDERFYLYVDDSEYTYRITKGGGSIWLIPASQITDIDKSQGLDYKQKLFHSHLLDLWNFRTYYHIRNRMYFYSRVAIQNNIVFQINKILYLAFLRVISILSGKTNAYNKLKVAVSDGLKGNLGKANSEKF
ncbi:MAG: glycosyl transferase family 2 [Daejeonella sp.]|nr:glycosyl transferase family 2 [Daejeonella sp.]